MSAVLLQNETPPVIARPTPFLKAAQWVVLTALILLLYSRVLYDLFLDWWTEPALSQGLLIPPLALYIAWLRRDTTFREPSVRELRGLWLVAASSAAFLAGRLGAEFFLCRISFVVLLVGIVWTFWGTARLKSLAFPFLLLATMVPLPSIVYNRAAAPLQLLASEVSTALVRIFGITVYRDGNLIYLAKTTLGVEEACSGLSSLSTLIVASVLLGFLHSSSPWVRTMLFALSVPISIAANVFRVAGTALLADYKVDLALGFYHLFSGWLVFVVGLIGLYLTAQLLEKTRILATRGRTA
jgi:exosortase